MVSCCIVAAFAAYIYSVHPYHMSTFLDFLHYRLVICTTARFHSCCISKYCPCLVSIVLLVSVAASVDMILDDLHIIASVMRLATAMHCRCSGHYYSNPSNWMWRILTATRIAPPHITGAQVS